MIFRLPSQVNTAIELLHDSGFEAYAVGGCVRDTVMGKEPHDFDITTSALPDEMKAVFEGFRVIETGIKHGTLTVIVEGMPLEITTFRIDGKYLDNRRPENVSFSRNLKDDLSRRDFTINTLCLNENNGLVDLLGGVDDIENKIIRCVGEPDKRFSEDALRIIRALRFSAVLGFEIEDKTTKSIFKNKELLKKIAIERIRDEFTKLVMGENACDVILKYHEVIEEFIPEFKALFGCEQNTPYHLFDVAKHTAYALKNVENDRILRLTMFFHDIAKPLCKTTDLNGFDHFKGHAALGEMMTKDILKRMRFDNATVSAVSALVGLHSERVPKTKIEAKLMLCETGIENCRAFIKIRKADCLAKANPHLQDEKLENFRRFLDEIEKNNECYSLAQLNINGNDLKQLGLKDGKKISIILGALLMEVIEEEIPNEAKALKNRAAEML